MLVVAGAGAGALEPLGAALGLAAAVVYTTYILVSDGIAGRVRAARARRRSSAPARRSRSRSASALLGELRPGELTAGGLGLARLPRGRLDRRRDRLFFAGLRRVGPTTASILATVEPVVTVALAFLVFGETLGPVQLAGGVLVLSAVPVLNARLPLHACARRGARSCPPSVLEADAPVEPGRRVDVEHPDGDGAVVAERVLDARRDEDERPGRRASLAVAERNVISPSMMKKASSSSSWMCASSSRPGGSR